MDNPFKDKKGQTERIENNQNEKIPQAAASPICPFQSNIDAQVSCTPDCKLYRPNRKNYECYFQELQSISWNGAELLKRMR